MSTSSISIVSRLSNYPDPEKIAEEILQWLLVNDIVKVVGDDYRFSEGARFITTSPDYLHLDIIPCELEIITKRHVFHFGEGEPEDVICPTCDANIAKEDWDFLNPWAEGESDNLICPVCKQGAEIHDYRFYPTCGFSNLGFSFWNMPPELTGEFIQGMKDRLACDIDIVYTHL